MSQWTKRSGIMLCYPFELKRLEKWGNIAYIQPKLDGVRCRAKWNGFYWELLSSEENQILSVPHIQDSLHQRWPEGGPELDGELYYHGKTFEEIFSITSRSEANLHPDRERMSLHVFDIIDEASQAVRLAYLDSLNIGEFPSLYKVQSSLIVGVEPIMQTYQELLTKGYEGIIARHVSAEYIRRRSTFVMKFKPKKSDWYQIIGYREEVDKYGNQKGSLGALVCCGDDGTEFSVGTGFSRSDRTDLWLSRDELIGKVAHVEYQHLTAGRGVPRFPVYVRVIDPKEITR